MYECPCGDILYSILRIRRIVHIVQDYAHWLDRCAFEEIIEGIELYGICMKHAILEYEITSGIGTLSASKEAEIMNCSYAMIKVYRKNLWLNCLGSIPVLKFEMTVYSARTRKHRYMNECVHHIPTESEGITGIEQLLHPFYEFLDKWRISEQADVLINWVSETILNLRIAAGLWDRIHSYPKYTLLEKLWYPPNFGEIGVIEYDTDENPYLMALTQALPS